MATCKFSSDIKYELTVTFDEAESIRDAIFEVPCETLDDVYHDLNCLLNNFGDGIVNLTMGLTEDQAGCLADAIQNDPHSDTDEAYWALVTSLEHEGIEMPYSCLCDACYGYHLWGDDEDDDGGGTNGAPAAPHWATAGYTGGTCLEA